MELERFFASSMSIVGQLEDHMREFQPKAYQRLHKMDRLAGMNRLSEMAENYNDEIDTLLQNGKNIFEAQEIVRPQFFTIETGRENGYEEEEEDEEDSFYSQLDQFGDFIIEEEPEEMVFTNDIDKADIDIEEEELPFTISHVRGLTKEELEFFLKKD